MKLIKKNNNYSFFSKIKIIIKNIIFLSVLILFLYIYFIKNITNNCNIIERDNEISQSQFKYIQVIHNLNYLKLFDINYIYSYNFNIIKIEYNFEFYESQSNLILPSDLTLYKNLHIFCHFEYNDSDIIINSFPDIIKNRNFKCIEYFNIDENIKFGIKIYEINDNREDIDNHIIYFSSQKQFNFLNLFNKNDEEFDPLIINKRYLSNITNNFKNSNLKLQKSFAKAPKYTLKKYLNFRDNEWSFENLFNEYFCFCKGLNSLKLKNSQNCKYYFYLNLIDKNRKVYLKTDYLFIDFIFNDLTSDDAYPIFKEMIREKSQAHYLTESSNIYNEYCFEVNNCQTVILVNIQNYTINGDFLEKYLTLFLKLKVVISGSGIYFDYFSNLFYDIEYITYISITHGVCYFKYFLYEESNCYGPKRFDKILIPPSEKLLSLAIKYGWKNEDIIKLNLPKWDKFNKYLNSSFKNMIYTNNSILIMFTWREILKNKKISFYYFNNIVNLILNRKLNEELKRNNITIYFALHHRIYNYKYIFEGIKYIKLVEPKDIIDYIEISSLYITDFSSIIFDFIYRRKPIIIYIPDHDDNLINNKYKKSYCELIQSMKDGTIEFENKYFDIESVVNILFFKIFLNINKLLASVFFIITGFFVLLSAGVVLAYAQQIVAKEHTGTISGIIQGFTLSLGALLLIPFGAIAQSFGVEVVLILITTIALISSLVALKIKFE